MREGKRERKRKEREREKTFFFSLVENGPKKKALQIPYSPPPPQQARLVLEGHHFGSGDRGAAVKREDVLDRRGGLALDL